MEQFLLVIITALISVTLTLVGFIYKGKDTELTMMAKRMDRMSKQIMACICALLSIVNHIEHLPDHIIADLQKALKEE